MLSAARTRLLQWLRVPPEPTPPPGSAESIRVFRAAPNFYHWTLVRWGGLQIGAALLLVSGLGFTTVVMRNPKVPRWLVPAVGVIEAASVAAFLLQIPVSLLKQRLDYEMRWYLVTDRSLRIREGIWRVEELTMTFANVQQINVERGPLQKLLGIADVAVASAGGGGGGEHGERASAHSHRAYFRGVGDAASIRDLIIERLRQYRGTGLGDHDETVTAAGSVPRNALDPARRLLEETRKLRESLERCEPQS